MTAEHRTPSSAAAAGQPRNLAPQHQMQNSDAYQPQKRRGVPVYVMLPLDTVTNQAHFQYASTSWFSRALGLLHASGVEGVAVDVWWGAVERQPGQYDWSGYQELFAMVKAKGLRIQAVMSFHACGGNVGDYAQVPLPDWVLQCGNEDPNLFCSDKPRDGQPGNRNNEYISLFADQTPSLQGRTPLECYADFMHAFREAFIDDIGVAIHEIAIGGGPCGELRYPSYVETQGWRFPGAGEFQCYDDRALASLAEAAAAVQEPDWGLEGPHDAGEYNSWPEDTGFFRGWGGAWDNPYGHFFMKWYSDNLLLHGERLCKIASSIFNTSRPQRCTPRYRSCHASSPLSSMSVVSDLSSVLRCPQPQPSSSSETTLPAVSASASDQKTNPLSFSASASVQKSTPLTASASSPDAVQQSGLSASTADEDASLSPCTPRMQSHSRSTAATPTSCITATGSESVQLDATDSMQLAQEHMPRCQDHMANSTSRNSSSSSSSHCYCDRTEHEPSVSNAPDNDSSAGRMVSDAQQNRQQQGQQGASTSPHKSGQSESMRLWPRHGARLPVHPDRQQARPQTSDRSQWRPAGQPVEVSLKIAGVHWWYNSRSHAAEMTAGYYNTEAHDGYAGILELCAQHGMVATLTCVEMCDAQHPPEALCGPEGLLRQVREGAAAAGVLLGGENALPCFVPGGVDQYALDRIVYNTKPWSPPLQMDTMSNEAPVHVPLLGHIVQKDWSHGHKMDDHNMGPAFWQERYGDGAVGPVRTLPVMRSFTFLRLIPDMMSPEYQSIWFRFMQQMQQTKDGE